MCSFLGFSYISERSPRRLIITVAHMVLVFLHQSYLHLFDSGSGYSLITLARDIPKMVRYEGLLLGG